MTEIRTYFDTELFQVFEPGETEVTLGNYRLTVIDSKPSVDIYGWRHNEKKPLFFIWKRTPLANGDRWDLALELDAWVFSEQIIRATIGANANSKQTFSLVEAEEFFLEIKEHIAAKRREHNSVMAKERAEKNKIEAAALGISVKDLLFQRKVNKLAQNQEKQVARLKEQVSRSFKYTSTLDTLENKIKETRARLETHEIERLHLSYDTHGFKWEVEKLCKMIDRLVKLKDLTEETKKAKKKKKTK